MAEQLFIDTQQLLKVGLVVDWQHLLKYCCLDRVQPCVRATCQDDLFAMYFCSHSCALVTLMRIFGEAVRSSVDRYQSGHDITRRTVAMFALDMSPYGLAESARPTYGTGSFFEVPRRPMNTRQFRYEHTIS